MKPQIVILLAAISYSGSAVAQEYAEPGNFNITKALLENGVNVAAIPQLHELGNERRSFSDPCAIAVCHYIQTREPLVDSSSVQLAQASIWKQFVVERRRLRCLYNRVLVITGRIY
jgi:hypothetical protein